MEEFKFKKQLGQNFIFDKNLLSSFCKDAKLTLDDSVLEIGAGAGTLTEVLAKSCRKVIAFEIDENLFETLQNLKKENDNIEFIFCDFLDFNLENLLKNYNEKLVVVANIPYCITGHIIKKLLMHRRYFKSIYLLVQKEAALKYVSEVGSRDYSASAAMLQIFADIKIKRIVGKENFVPNPKVDSAFMEIALKNIGENLDFENLNNFVSGIFLTRRKTLFNNLNKNLLFSKNAVENALNRLNLPPDIRAQNLKPEQILNLYLTLKNI